MQKHFLFLTGGSGSLGRNLVARLAREPAVEVVYLLVRDTPRGALPAKVVPVFGDLSAGPHFGLSPAQQQMLRGKVTAVLHGAADTRFNAPLAEAYEANVEGTRNLLQFAASCPDLDRLVHLSTLCAAGKRTGRLREVPLVAKHGFVNFYEATKCQAENLVQQAATTLPISILRLSTVIGSEQTGAIHQLGAFHHALRLMYCSLVPMMPARPYCPVDLISLEYATETLTWLLVHRFRPGSIYHLCAAQDYLPLDELLDLTYDTFAASRPAWRRRLIERPTVVNAATYELFRQTVEESGAHGLINSLRLLSSFAPQLLYPKTYDDAQCQESLTGSGIERRPLREFFPKIVRALLADEEKINPTEKVLQEVA